MDMYSARVHGPSRRGGRQDARVRRVGGGQGDGGAYRAPACGFAGRAPGRFQYGYGPRDRGFGGDFDAPRFFLVVVFVSHAVDGTGDTLCLVLLTLL